MPELLYFCELLSNIKQVSVSIDRQDGERLPTAVTLHPSRRALTITFGNEVSHIILPTPIDSPSRTLAPATSYRLLASQSFLSSSQFESIAESAPIPWDASNLNSKISIHCTTCTTQIIPQTRIQKWKNLPSEHWADLMDLWHCHKPHNEKGNSEGGKYAGIGRILAERAVGLVDPMYFLVRREDCDNITVEQQGNLSDAETVVCRECSAPLGIVDPKADGIRLMKWSLSLGSGTSNNDIDGKMESYTMFQWLSAHLLTLVENTGQRKFLVKPGASILSQQTEDGSKERSQESSEGVHIWAFNPNTLVTRSGKPTPTRALKVYYQRMGSQSEIEQLGDIETVYLPEAIYSRFKQLLNEGNASLPQDLRTWAGTWKGGWLERF